MAERRYSDLTLYRRILSRVRPFRLQIGAILLLNLLATPFALLNPIPLKIVIDHVLGDLPPPTWLAPVLPEDPNLALLFAIGLLLAVTVLGRVRGLGAEVLEQKTGERLLLRFRGDLFRHLQRLSFAFHDSKGVADSVYRIQYDAMSVQSVLIHRLIPAISAALMVTTMLYVIVVLDWQMGLVAIAVSPLLFLLAGAYRRRLRTQWTEVKEHESAAMSVIHEVMGALRVVKAFGQEDRESDRFFRRSDEGVRAKVRATMTSGSMSLLIQATVAVGTAAVLFLGVQRIRSGTLTLGDLIVVMGYLGQLYDPLKTLSTESTRLQSSLAGAERAFSILDQAPDVPVPSDPVRVERATGRIEFEGVTFGYRDGRPVVRDVDLQIEPGARVGVAGPTGAGKSTLLSLLMRFYDPDAGRVLLDGVDLRDYDLDDLRSQFALVLQEPVLFSTSVAENIGYARPAATIEEIMDAARAARAHDFIAALPEGYDTPVGDRGMRLSGGERQRLALARAFLKDAPILLLDEPTSSVDVRTEAAILEALNRLMEGRTTLMIAHRLGTLAGCDLRLTVDDGRVREAAWEPAL